MKYRKPVLRRGLVSDMQICCKIDFFQEYVSWEEYLGHWE